MKSHQIGSVVMLERPYSDYLKSVYEDIKPTYLATEQKVAVISKRVSPWLWILSITSFTISAFSFISDWQKGRFN